MLAVGERKENRKSIYCKTLIDEDGVIVSEREVDITLAVEGKNGREYYVIFDEDMKIIEEAYHYLNVVKAKNSPNTRRAIANALRILYSFLSLFNYDIRKLDRESIDKLCNFLRGIDSNPKGFSLTTIRSNKTINGYLGMYREYFRSSEIRCPALFDAYVSKTKYLFGKDEAITTERKRYSSSLPESSVGKKEVPKHITPDQFRRIYKIAMEHGDEQTMIILILLYGYGLRIGECLGITIEDITEIRENGRLVPVLFLRNRMSDRASQHCKGLPHITSKKQYGTRDYSRNRHKIVLSYEFYERLYKFIESTHIKYVDPTHSEYTKKAAARYEATTIADTVTRSCPVDPNRYVFLNRLGRPLGQTWDELLASYMKEAGIPLDRSVGKDSLSHRFRHGFAMFHAHYKEKPVRILELKEMMRHKSVTSTEIYFNLTLEEEFELQKEFQEEMFMLIPELKDGITAITG